MIPPLLKILPPNVYQLVLDECPPWVYPYARQSIVVSLPDSYGSNYGDILSSFFRPLFNTYCAKCSPADREGYLVRKSIMVGFIVVVESCMTLRSPRVVMLSTIHNELVAV